MLRKRYAGLIALATLPGLAGCAQATRHSNTMVFGTSTTVGVKVGQDVNQMPQVLIAYDRQEAVIMPLLANTGEKSGSGNLLSPCPLATTGTPAPTPSPTPSPAPTLGTADGYANPCKFVAIRESSGGLVIQDSYSVLASFGAQIEGSASNNEGAVGLAQYFATGAAAQTLAMTGGAAVVAVGDGAEKSADNAPQTAANAAASLGGDPVPVGSGKTFDQAWGKLITDVGSEDDAQKRLSTVQAAIASANIAPGPAQRIEQQCAGTKETCLAKLADSAALFNSRSFYAAD